MRPLAEAYRTGWAPRPATPDLEALAREIYGPLPRPVPVTYQSVALPQATHMALDLGGFPVDAALWCPPEPKALIVGLDFIGPAGVMTDDAFPLDPKARVYARPEYGAPEGRLAPVLRGVSASRWPVELIASKGYALLLSCYGSWAPDDPVLWRNGAAQAEGAVSLWAWALSRLVDVAEAISIGPIYAAGHSRLGKAALWAAANDPRIAGVFASSSGCGGAAPAAHPVGETRAQMAERFPHWTLPPAKTQTDQQDLLAAIAPRAVYLAGAEDDLWADPVGAYLALGAASRQWGIADWPGPEAYWQPYARITRGPIGAHLRPGGHDLTPHDWHGALDFFDRQ